MYFDLKILKILFTLFRSTCFGHPCAHHQELFSCTCSLWSRVVLGSLCPPVLLCCNCCFFVCLWVGTGNGTDPQTHEKAAVTTQQVCGSVPVPVSTHRHTKKQKLQHSRTGGHNEPSTTRDQRLHVQLRSS